MAPPWPQPDPAPNPDPDPGPVALTRHRQWHYIYAGANPLINVYYYSHGRRATGRAVDHMDGLKAGKGVTPIM